MRKNRFQVITKSRLSPKQLYDKKIKIKIVQDGILIFIIMDEESGMLKCNNPPYFTYMYRQKHTQNTIN